MEYLKVGSIVDSFGLDGSVKIYTTTDFPMERFHDDAIIYIARNNKVIKEVTVNGYKKGGKFDYLAFNEILVKEEAEQYKGCELLIDKNDADVPDGYVRFFDLVGSNVKNENGDILGIVSMVEEFPAQLTLRCKRKGKPDFLVPFVPAFIIKTDIENKEIVINVIEGML